VRACPLHGCCVGDSDVSSICVLKEQGGGGGRAVASLASSLAPGLGRNIELQLQQADRTVQLYAVWRQLLIL
jgi:hypothetical protein